MCKQLNQSPEFLAAQAQLRLLRKKPPRKAKKIIKKPQLSPSQQRGQQYEQQAAHYLEQHGLTILLKNLGLALGEIDIVARHEQHLVFIEVRQRRSTAYGGAIYSVQRQKQKRIKQTAVAFLPRLTALYFNGKTPFCRFDVIAIEGETLHWIKDAFH